MKPELLNEETIDEVCNEAFDELLTQEFNPDQDDFEDDVVSEPDTNKDAGRCLLAYSMYTFLPLHPGSHLNGCFVCQLEFCSGITLSLLISHIFALQALSARTRAVGLPSYFRLKLTMQDLEESASPRTQRLGPPTRSMSGDAATATVPRNL